MRIYADLPSTTFTASQEFKLDPNYEHTFGLNGSGVWQFWDGAAWKTFAESSGSTQGFIARPLGNGRVNLSVTSGTVTAEFSRILPEGRTRKGNQNR